MRTREFVEACKRERDAMFALYANTQGGTVVATRLAAANLSDQQRQEVLSAFSAALTDSFYTMLLALAGEASLGGMQQQYRLLDEAGGSISPSEDDDDLETVAYEVFQTDQ